MNMSSQSASATLARIVAGESPGRIGAGNQGAHAGAGDAVDRHAQFLEHFEDADVRRAARAAATQHEADLRPAGLGKPLGAQAQGQSSGGKEFCKRGNGLSHGGNHKKTPRRSGVFGVLRRITWCR